MPDFYVRVLVLFAFLGAMVGYDRWRHGAEARRSREYAFLLACGGCGALLGVLQDQVSLSVSADYFLYGKGVAAGADFRWRASQVGLHAGVFAGLLAGGLLLLVNQPSEVRAALPLRAAFRRALPRVAGLALAGVPLGYFLGPPLLPRGLLDGLDLGAARERGFLQVWGMHLGLYGGAAGGLIWALASVRRARPEPSAPPPSPAQD